MEKEIRAVLSSPSGPNEVQKFIYMTDSVLCVFLESVFQEPFFFLPKASSGTTLFSYDGLISHFLGQLCGHRALGGVRPLHVGHEQAHFLIGPPPL